MPTVPKKELLIVLPFLGKFSHEPWYNDIVTGSFKSLILCENFNKKLVSKIIDDYSETFF